MVNRNTIRRLRDYRTETSDRRKKKKRDEKVSPHRQSVKG